jgi:hypothetical protein
MLVTTTENIPGYRTTHTMGRSGVVVRAAALRAISWPPCARSSGARSRNIPRWWRIHAAMRSTVWLPMRGDGRRCGGDDALRSGQIGQAMNEVVAYGTAVKIERI